MSITWKMKNPALVNPFKRWRFRVVAASLLTLGILPTLAQVASPVSFSVTYGQGPGPWVGHSVVSDPTIQPYQEPGFPAPIGLVLPVDLRGIGQPDLIACHSTFPPLTKAKMPCRILRPQADGLLIDVTRQLLGNGSLPSAEHQREFVVGDFNKDGRMDLFVAAHGYDAAPFAGETNLLLISNADGTYADRSSTLPQQPDFSHSACAGDVNRDGNLDIYVNNISIDTGTYFLMGNGDGTFAKVAGGLPASVQSANEGFLSCAIADTDADGMPDLILGRWSHNGFVDSIVLFGNGAGDFTTRPRYILPSAAQAIVIDIAVLDINRDGRPDLILATQTGDHSLSGFGLQILINQGNGVFADETSTRLTQPVDRSDGPFCAFMRLTDLNNDGWEDFYCDSVGAYETLPRVWINNGNGTWTFLLQSQMPEQSLAGSFHVIDFNGDGKPDLVRLGFGGSTPDIGYRTWLNTTSRSVPSPPIVRTGIPGNGLAAITFNLPLSQESIPITGYVATCREGSKSTTFSAMGDSSPILVTGLTNDALFSCTVTASSAMGASLPSSPVDVLPSATAPLALVAVKSRKVHGMAGAFSLPIDYTATIGGAITVESRSVGTGHQILFQFNAPIANAGTASMIDGAAMPFGSASAMHSGNDITVSVTGVVDNQRVRVLLDGVNGNVNVSAPVGFLLGDVNRSRALSAADIAAVKARSGKSANAFNFGFDLNASGTIDASDLSMVKGRSGVALP